MSFTLDPEVAEALAPFASPAGSTPPPAGDVARSEIPAAGEGGARGVGPGSFGTWINGTFRGRLASAGRAPRRRDGTWAGRL